MLLVIECAADPKNETTNEFNFRELLRILCDTYMYPVSSCPSTLDVRSRVRVVQFFQPSTILLITFSSEVTNLDEADMSFERVEVMHNLISQFLHSRFFVNLLQFVNVMFLFVVQ